MFNVQSQSPCRRKREEIADLLQQGIELFAEFRVGRTEGIGIKNGAVGLDEQETGNRHHTELARDEGIFLAVGNELGPRRTVFL